MHYLNLILIYLLYFDRIYFSWFYQYFISFYFQYYFVKLIQIYSRKLVYFPYFQNYSRLRNLNYFYLYFFQKCFLYLFNCYLNYFFLILFLSVNQSNSQTRCLINLIFELFDFEIQLDHIQTPWDFFYSFKLNWNYQQKCQPLQVFQLV